MTQEPSPFLGSLLSAQEFFDRATSQLTEADSGFRPQPDMLSVAQQMAHVAHTITWFVDGALSPEGFALDFEAQEAQVREANSLTTARAAWVAAVDRAKEVLETTPAAFWNETLPEGPVLGGCPKSSIWGGIVEHTAHHRGSLAVYTRLVGRTPPMPYADEGDY